MNAQVATPTVYVVDDDISIRRALPRLLRAVGMEAMAFDSLAALLAENLRRADVCVIADIRLDQEDGLELPRLLAARGLRLPVIFLTAVDTADMRERAFRAGGTALFCKPVDDQALIDAIRWALAKQPSREVR